MQNRLVCSVVAAVLLVVGCGDDPESSSTVEQASSVDKCAGSFACSDGENTTATTLVRGPNGCTAGRLLLHSDGRATAEGLSSEAKWHATSESFEVCLGDKCLTCRASGASPTSSKPTGRCQGVASSCYGRGAGSCSSQDGCRFAQHSHISWNGQLEFRYECEGYSEPCSAFDAAEGCERQDGCKWE
jgi:hypothetical protein